MTNRAKIPAPATKSSRRTDGRWTLALFLLALLPRVVHLLTFRDSPFFSILVLDPLMYDEWGWALARGEGPVGRVFFQDPLYAYFLAAVYSVFGHRYLPVAAIQLLLGALVAPLSYMAARPWFGRPAACVAGVVSALYVPAIYYDGLVLKTSLGLFLVAALLASLSLAVRRRSPLLWGVAGVVLGLGCLTRGNLVLLVPVVAVWALVDTPSGADERIGLRGRLIDPARWSVVGALLLGCALVLIPTALRNRAVGSEWVLTTSNAGQNFYIGNNPLNDTGEYQRLPFVDPNPKYEERDFAREASRRLRREVGVRETSRFWSSEALSWIRSDPKGWARLTWLKLRAYWGAYEIPDNLDYYLYREDAPVLRAPVPGFGLVAPLGLLGAALAWRMRGWPRLLVLFAAAYSLTVVLFFVFSRFRMAMMPAVYVLAGHGAVVLWQAMRGAGRDRSARRRAAAIVAGFLVLLAFVNLPVRARKESLTATAAIALRLPLRIETSATAHFNLGVAYAAQANDADEPDAWLELAESELRQALADEKRYASVPTELGKVLARRGRNEEAVRAYEQALQIEPGNYRTHHALGLLRTRLGDLGGASTSFRRALELEPRHVASAVRLGETLLELGRPAQAVGAFRHALALAPDNARAAEGLRSAEGKVRDD